MTVALFMILLVGGQATELRVKSKATQLAADFFHNNLRGNVLSNWAQDAHEAASEDDDDEEDDTFDHDDAAEEAADAQLAISLTHGMHPQASPKKDESEASPKTAASGEHDANFGSLAFHANSKESPKEPVKATEAATEASKKEATPAGLTPEKSAKEEKTQESAKEAKEPSKADKETAKKAADEEEDDEEDDEDDEKEEAEGALEAAKDKLTAAKTKYEAFSDDKAFNGKLAHQMEGITNETQSPALSNFLGELRAEVREYAKGGEYGEELEKRTEKAEKRVKELEEQLGKAKKDGAAAAACFAKSPAPSNFLFSNFNSMLKTNEGAMLHR